MWSIWVNVLLPLMKCCRVEACNLRIFPCFTRIETATAAARTAAPLTQALSSQHLKRIDRGMASKVMQQFIDEFDSITLTMMMTAMCRWAVRPLSCTANELKDVLPQTVSAALNDRKTRTLLSFHDLSTREVRLMSFPDLKAAVHSVFVACAWRVGSTCTAVASLNSVFWSVKGEVGETRQLHPPHLHLYGQIWCGGCYLSRLVVSLWQAEE